MAENEVQIYEIEYVTATNASTRGARCYNSHRCEPGPVPESTQKGSLGWCAQAQGSTRCSLERSSPAAIQSLRRRISHFLSLAGAGKSGDLRQTVADLPSDKPRPVSTR